MAVLSLNLLKFRPSEPENRLLLAAEGQAIRAPLFGRQEFLSPKQEILSPKSGEHHAFFVLRHAVSLLFAAPGRFTLLAAKLTLLTRCATRRAGPSTTGRDAAGERRKEGGSWRRG